MARRWQYPRSLTQRKRTVKTVWEFRSVDGKQVVRVVRPARADDMRTQHEYQRVVYRGDDAEKIKNALAQ